MRNQPSEELGGTLRLPTNPLSQLLTRLAETGRSVLDALKYMPHLVTQTLMQGVLTAQSEPIREELSKNAPDPEHAIKEFFELLETPILDPTEMANDFQDKRHGAHPIHTPIEPLLAALRSNPEASGPVVAVSMGGTNIKRASGEASMLKGVSITNLSTDTVKKDYVSMEDFWSHLFPADLIENIKSTGDGAAVAVTLAFPLEPVDDDWQAVHLAGKFSAPFMGPQFPGQEFAGERPALQKSLQQFLQEKTGLTDIKVVFSPNDTISTQMAFAQTEVGENQAIGALIAGTGGNIAVGAINAEAGHYRNVKPNLLERLVFEELNMNPDLESMFSGKILDKIFLKAIEIIFGSKSATFKHFTNLSADQINKLLFQLAYEGESAQQTLSDLAPQEKTGLMAVAQQLAARSAYYTAALLATMKDYVGQDIHCFAEGSLVTKNPGHVAAINQHLQERFDINDTKLARQDLNINQQASTTKELSEADASLVGTMMFALSAKL